MKKFPKQIAPIFQKTAKKVKTDDQLESSLPQLNNNSQIVQFDDFIKSLQSWEEHLKSFTSSEKFKKIYKFIHDEYQTKKIYPPFNKVFNAFQQTPWTQLKVVIVGQDPYHQKDQAMGLSFSVPKNIKVPPSLKNIYKCMENDKNLNGFKQPNHGDLTNWAKQGVLLLNTVFTVEDSKPQSHEKCGWKQFSHEVIKQINLQQTGIIFLLWGAPAQEFENLIDGKKHFVLKSSHPSPLSAFRGFLDCQHFSRVNEVLKEQNKQEINWNL